MFLTVWAAFAIAVRIASSMLFGLLPDLAQPVHVVAHGSSSS